MSHRYERLRYEVKYPVRFEQGSKLLATLAPPLVPDTHGKSGQYVVYTVYFDTRKLNFYYEKIDGFAGRVKFRLRTYLGYSEPLWFLESKERVRHYISKHRIRLNREQADMLISSYLSPGTIQGIVPPDHVIAVNLGRVIKYGVLIPTVATYYRRNAYIFKGAREVRVTLDHNLMALAAKTLTAKLPGILPIHHRDQYLIEVKGNGWMPMEVVNAVCKNSLVARSFSKYCACIEQAYHFPVHG